MKKGYSISYQNNKVISSVKDLDLKRELKIKMFDGEVITKIIGINEEENGK